MPDQEKDKPIGKKVRARIPEDLFSHQFFLRVIKSLLQQETHFGKDIMVHSPLGDAMMARIMRNGDELVIATGGEEDPYIYVKGDSRIVRDFVEHLAIEASTLIALEFCSALEELCTVSSKEKLKQKIREKLKEALDEVLV